MQEVHLHYNFSAQRFYQKKKRQHHATYAMPLAWGEMTAKANSVKSTKEVSD
jgi:hypothetical protein